MHRLNFAFLLIIVTVARQATALTWEFQTIRDNHLNGAARSVAVAGDGRVHVVYAAHANDGSDPGLNHASRTPATSWQVTTLATTAGSSLYGNAEIKLDTANNPYVAYRIPSGGMRLMRHTGTAWSSPISFSGSGTNSLTLSAAVDSANDLHLAYTVTGGTLRYAFWDRSANSISYRDEVHNFTYVFEQVSLVLHPTSERPRVTYTRNDDLTYAVRGSSVTSAWTSEIVRASSVTATNICGGSMAFNGTTALCSYIDEGGMNLYLASDSGNPWARELVSSVNLGSGTSFTRLFFDSSGKPYIVWLNGDGSLYVSCKRGSAWKTTVLADTSGAGFGATMSADRLYVAYMTPDRSTVRLATANASPTAHFEGWTESMFTPTQLADPLISGSLADPDKDGVVNLLEFAFNMHPLTVGTYALVPGTGTQGMSAVRLGSGGTGSQEIYLEFVRRRAASNSGITYHPEFSSSLTGTWTAGIGETSVSPINDEWERVTVVEYPPMGTQSRFARLRVVQEP